MVFKPEFSWEFLPENQIAEKSIRALRNHLKFVKEVSPYYRDKLQGIPIEEFNSLDQLKEIPFTSKDDLARFGEAFVAVPPEQVVETVITSGSTGKPIAIPLTSNDLDRLAFNEALSFHSIGVDKSDRAQIVVSLDRLFIAGMAYYRGLILLGANTSRVGVLPLDMYKQCFELLKPTVLVGVPSFLQKLSIELSKSNFDLSKTTLKHIVCIGESLKTQELELNALGQFIEKQFHAPVYSTYAATEIAVSYCECSQRNGGHAHPELVYTEIVDPDGKPLPDGVPGELVATPFGIEGLPLVRYKTGDITFKISTPCACGRNSVRLGPILGRKNQMIKAKGTTLYPLTITNALDTIPEINDYIIVIENDDSLSDRVSIHVAAPANMVEKIASQVRAAARVNFPILISNVTTIQSLRGAARKKIRVLDWRKS